MQNNSCISPEDIQVDVVRASHGQLFSLIAATLFKFDPAEINFGTNEDEYEYEAARIVTLLQLQDGPTSVQRMLLSVFRGAFDKEMFSARDFTALAQEIWSIRKYN